MISELDYSLTPELSEELECDFCEESGARYCDLNDGRKGMRQLCKGCRDQAKEDGEEVTLCDT